MALMFMPRSKRVTGLLGNHLYLRGKYKKFFYSLEHPVYVCKVVNRMLIDEWMSGWNPLLY